MMEFNRTTFFNERHQRFASTKRRGRAAAPKLRPSSELTTLATRRLRQIVECQPTELVTRPRLSQNWQASHTNPFTYPRVAPQPPSLSEYPSYLPITNWTGGDKRYTNSRCELVRGSLCKLIMELHFEGSGLHEIEQSLPELDTYGQREVPFDVHDINAIILACMHQGLRPETPHRADEWIVEDNLFWDNKHYMREKWRNMPVRSEESGVPDGWWVDRENARNRDWIREERMDLSIGPEYRETRWQNRGPSGAS